MKYEACVWIFDPIIRSSKDKNLLFLYLDRPTNLNRFPSNTASYLNHAPFVFSNFIAFNTCHHLVLIETTTAKNKDITFSYTNWRCSVSLLVHWGYLFSDIIPYVIALTDICDYVNLNLPTQDIDSPLEIAKRKVEFFMRHGWSYFQGFWIIPWIKYKYLFPCIVFWLFTPYEEDLGAWNYDWTCKRRNLKWDV